VLDGPIGNEFFSQLDAKGVLGLGWSSAGFKQLCTTVKPILTPDDMKGVRIRIQAGAVFAATYQALGAIPVTIDVNETFTALSQHTVDAADFSLEFITSGKFYTVLKHIAMTNHTVPVVPILANKQKIQSLPSALAQIVRNEAKSAAAQWRSDLARLLASDVQVLKDAGVTFTDVQYAPFRKAMDPVYASFESKFSKNLLQRVSRAAG
jgi:TRAP-type C4-dicarboxylate transport system substrate-binding protein